MIEVLELDFFQRALAAGLLASVACGIAGTLIVVQRLAATSGGLAHAAFGGVGLGYLVGFPPILGAALFAVGGAMVVAHFERRQAGGLDALITMFWAVGMALGVVFIALTPGYAPELMSYLFGNILFVPIEYLFAVLGLDLLILLVLWRFRRLFVAVVFDEEQAEIAGAPVRATKLAMLALIALTIVVLIRVVGIVLVLALLTIPAMVAQHWARSLRQMVLFAVTIGATCVVVGLFGSYRLDPLPPGPLIVLVGAVVFVLSLFVRQFVQHAEPEPAEPAAPRRH